MNELNRLRSFRARVAAPSPAARASARARLERTIRADAGPPRRPAAVLRRARPRTRRGRLAAVGALVAALALAGLGAGTLGGGPTVLERAQAALLPNGRILHVVVRIVGADATTRGESWILADGSRGRSVEPAGGEAADCVSSPTELRCWDAGRNVIDVYRYNPEAVAKGDRYADLPQFRIDRPQSLSRALGSGYARLLGEARMEGRAVYAVLLAVPWLGPDGTATPIFLDGVSPTIYLDRETLYPVAQEFPDAGSTTYYETFEFLPADAEHRALLELPAPVGAQVVVHPLGEGPQG